MLFIDRVAVDKHSSLLIRLCKLIQTQDLAKRTCIGNHHNVTLEGQQQKYQSWTKVCSLVTSHRNSSIHIERTNMYC